MGVFCLLSSNSAELVDIGRVDASKVYASALRLQLFTTRANHDPRGVLDANDWFDWLHDEGKRRLAGFILVIKEFLF